MCVHRPATDIHQVIFADLLKVAEIGKGRMTTDHCCFMILFVLSPYEKTPDRWR